MNCRDISELLPLYLSGELDSQHQADFAAHTEGCRDCAQTVRRERYYDERLREIVLSDSTDAESVSRRVRAQIAAPAAPIRDDSGPRSARRFAAAALAIAAAFGLILLGYRGLLGPQIAHVYAAAVLDHQIEVVDGQKRHWLTDPQQIADLARRQGIAPSAVVALALPGYHVERAKLCLLGVQVFLHLVYSNGSQELSVYLRRQDVGDLPGVARASANGDSLYSCSLNAGHVASFQKSNLAVVIVSKGSTPAAMNFAHLAFSALTAGSASNTVD